MNAPEPKRCLHFPVFANGYLAGEYALCCRCEECRRVLLMCKRMMQAAVAKAARKDK